MCSLFIAMQLRSKILSGHRDVYLPISDTIRRDLAEHFHWIEPSFDALKTDFIIHFGYCNSLNIDFTTVGFDSDLLAFTAEVSVGLYN
jgi:hypothetical protein